MRGDNALVGLREKTQDWSVERGVIGAAGHLSHATNLSHLALKLGFALPSGICQRI